MLLPIVALVLFCQITITVVIANQQRKIENSRVLFSNLILGGFKKKNFSRHSVRDFIFIKEGKISFHSFHSMHSQNQNSTLYFSKTITIMKFSILAVALLASTALVSVTLAAGKGGVRGSIDPTQTHRSLQYSKVTIQNDTPHHSSETIVSYTGLLCSDDIISEGIATGYKWTGPKRGLCSIDLISTTLDLPTGPLECGPYANSSGTSRSEFFIIFINGECCVRGSNQDLHDSC